MQLFLPIYLLMYEIALLVINGNARKSPCCLVGFGCKHAPKHKLYLFLVLTFPASYCQGKVEIIIWRFF